MYSFSMDVPVSELRSHLREWVDKARAGDDVVITDRGVPVARLVGLDTTTTIQRHKAEGVVGDPASPIRPRSQDLRPVRARGSVSDLVADMRDER
jgi:prevent-host-death family protein